jgi:hypothetical protein
VTAFDPFGWLTRRGRDSSSRASELPWLDAWVRATTWWMDPEAWADFGGEPFASAERMLFDLVEGLARRFAGRRVELKRGGATIRFVLDSLRIERRGDVEARLDALDVDWGGYRVERANAVARQVSLEPGVPARLSSRTVDVTGSARPESLGPWLEPRLPGSWSLRDAGEGLVAARPRRGPVELRVVPSLVRRSAGCHEVRLELHEVAVAGRAVRLPQRLRPGLTRSLPPLPDGVELLDASYEGGLVRFRLRFPGWSEPLDLDRLREAVLRGDPAFMLG